mmetsp:Transcript_14486/g.40683  ORF Transcript_14486/g.40683 Transcript_14486/m.40683 type:complete len:115 (-) Transcript_14486:1015-1359(-)
MAMMVPSLMAPALINAPVMPVAGAARVAVPKMAFVDSIEGVGEETGNKIWDPLGISDAVSDEAVMWFRHSELKHGRVAMVRNAHFLSPVQIFACASAWKRRLPGTRTMTSGAQV